MQNGTVLIERTQTIAGRPAVEVRGWMRELHWVACSSAAFAETYGVPARDAQRVLDELIALELIRLTDRAAMFRVGADEDPLHPPPLYTTTISGNALAKARIGKAMSRSQAEKLLADVIARACAINESDEWLHWVVEVQLYGSLARGDSETVGDIDVAARLLERYPHDEYLHRQRDMIDHDQARPGSIVEEIGYAQTKVMRHLRGRSPKVDLVELSDRQPLPEGATATVVYRWGGRAS